MTPTPPSPAPLDAPSIAEARGAAPKRFDYDEAFSRNIGWVTREEQAALRSKRVAIAGMGGVGGVHLLTLARLGVGAFHISDFDTFDVANCNRQAGALASTFGLPKCEALMRMALDINPELDIKAFPEGVGASNMAQFLDGVDCYVDGLDFFAFDARRDTFAACHAAGIPAVTAAPLGMGTSVLSFLPGKMSFEDYFGWGDSPEDEKALRFLIGLAPAGLHAPYLVDPSTVDMSERRGPSTIMGCQLAAGVAATEALKLLLGRGGVVHAPSSLQFDAYRGRMRRVWRPWGNANPWQRLMLAVARRRLAAMKLARASAPEPARPE